MSKYKPKQVVSKISPDVTLSRAVPDWKAYLFLTLFAFILYANSLKNDYVLDDAIVFTQNEFVQKGVKGIPEIFKYDTFVGFWLKNSDGKTADQIQEEKKELVEGGRYRPLSLVTFALEAQFFGKQFSNSKGEDYKANPFVSHTINIILYIFTVLLLFKILYRILSPNKGSKWYFSLPFIICLLFVAHPIHTEVVANVKGRDEIMTLLGSLAALWFTIKYFDTNKKYNLILSGIFLFLGLLSKENAITFLAIIPINTYYFINKKLSKNVFSLISLIIASGVFLIIRASILGSSANQSDITPEIMNNPFLGVTNSQRIATIFLTLWMYVKLLFFPHPLTYDYYPKQIPIIDWSHPGAFLPFILYLAMGIYAVYGLIKKRDIVSYSIWFYLIPLSVVSNIFFSVGTFMNERFIFISSIGFCIFIGWLIYAHLPKLLKNKKFQNYAICIIMLLILSLYSVKTISRNKAWENDLVLFTTDVQVSSNSAKSNCSAGGKILEEAQKSEIREDKAKHTELCQKSLKYLHRAIEIYPDYADALNLLGNAYFEYDYKVDKSLHYYYVLLRASPNHLIGYDNCRKVSLSAIALINSGKIYPSPENLQDIITSCDELLHIFNNLGEVHYLKAVIYGRYLNDMKKSLINFEKAESLNNFNKTADFYKDIGVAYGLSANFEKSLGYFLKAIELDPNDFQTYINVGVTYKNLGDLVNSDLYINKGVEIRDRK
jgi:tetratricopeptide (TPR) repeat protein